MGSWNYGKSPRICTLAYKDIDCPEFSEDEIKDEYFNNAEFMGESYDLEHAKHNLEEQFYEYINDRFKDCKFKLENQGFKYYKVSVESGYYQGFCVGIDHEFYYLDSPSERILMHKELTQIRQKLRHCIREFGLRVHYPGYCPGWEDTVEKSLKKLQESVKIEREYINKMLVVLSYNDICDLADGKEHLSPELKAKDNAKENVRNYILKEGLGDVDKFDCPEEAIDDFCDNYGLFFDDKGNIVKDMNISYLTMVDKYYNKLNLH